MRCISRPIGCPRLGGTTIFDFLCRSFPFHAALLPRVRPSFPPTLLCPDFLPVGSSFAVHLWRNSFLDGYPLGSAVVDFLPSRPGYGFIAFSGQRFTLPSPDYFHQRSPPEPLAPRQFSSSRVHASACSGLERRFACAVHDSGALIDSLATLSDIYAREALKLEIGVWILKGYCFQGIIYFEVTWNRFLM